MADRIPPERRSANIAKIRSKDTRPEMIVRRAAHALGYRYRLHRKDLPGKPDLVFPAARSVICAWMLLAPARRLLGLLRIPVEAGILGPEFEATVARDGRAVEALLAAGWRVLTIWECETTDAARLRERLLAFLGPQAAVSELN